MITRLHERAVGFRILTDQINTTTSGGKLIFHVFGALAKFERDLIRERTPAGLAAARVCGQLGGRPRKPDSATKVPMAQALYDDRRHSIADTCMSSRSSRTNVLSMQAEPHAASPRLERR